MGFVAAPAAAYFGITGAQEEGQTAQALDFLNQQSADVSAADALARGGQEAAKARMAGSQLIAKQKVGYATAGVDTQSGSALDAMADTRMMSELDAQTIRNNAAREALGYKLKSVQYGFQGKLDKQRQTNAMVSGAFKGASDTMSSASFLGG